MKDQQARPVLTILALGLLVPALAGCATAGPSFEERMDSYLGCTAKELLESWGPPTQVIDDGQGGRVFVYSWQETSPGQARTKKTDEETRTTYQPGPTTTYHRMFWLDSQGVVYRWSTK